MNRPSATGRASVGSSSRQSPPAQRSETIISLMQNSMTGLEEMRTLITCRVCVRLLYEPYTISCGHTFCYTCLRQWFGRNRSQKTCPDCRSKVLQQPAPAYLVRDITQIFISRAELLPAGESIEDHKRWQKEEADIVEKDKQNNSHDGGLFAGRFGRSRHTYASAIRDVEDGVDRCPICAWELTDEGRCTSCDFDFGDGHSLSHSLSDSTSLSVSDISEDDDVTSLTGTSTWERFGLADLTRRHPSRTSAEVDPHINDFSSLSPLESYLSTVTDDDLGDTDDETSEEDDLGSLRGFIAEEGETEDEILSPLSPLSPRSSHYDSDDTSGIFEALGAYSAGGRDDGQGDNDVSQESTTDDSISGTSANSSNIISIEDDDSDEGPVLRSRARTHRRSVTSPNSNRTPGDDVPLTTRGRRSTREPHRQAPVASNPLLDRRNSPSSRVSESSSRVSESSSTASRGMTIETESDNNSPLVRRPRVTQGRSAPRLIISDDEDDAATASSGSTSRFSRQSSTGTITIGRRSPARLDSRNQEDPAPIAPTIIISSSPEPAHRPHLPRLEPSREPVQRSVGSPGSRRSFRNFRSPRRHMPSSSHTHHAAGLRSNAGASPSHIIQRHQHLAHERAARQVGRILKKERTQRRARERASEGLGPPRAPGGPQGAPSGSRSTAHA